MRVDYQVCDKVTLISNVNVVFKKLSMTMRQRSGEKRYPSNQKTFRRQHAAIRRDA